MSEGLHQTARLHLQNGAAGQGAVDLVLLYQRVHCDDLELLGYLLDHFVKKVLIVDNGVVLLVSDLTLGPLLRIVATHHKAKTNTKAKHGSTA